MVVSQLWLIAKNWINGGVRVLSNIKTSSVLKLMLLIVLALSGAEGS
jgi:hypothetical protein